MCAVLVGLVMCVVGLVRLSLFYASLRCSCRQKMVIKWLYVDEYKVVSDVVLVSVPFFAFVGEVLSNIMCVAIDIGMVCGCHHNNV